MLQAIIFDVDGTLADTEEVHRESFNRAFAEAGLDWHWDQPLYAQLLQVTGGKERIAHFMDTTCPGHYAPVDRDALVAKLHPVKTRIYEHLIEQGNLELRPGVAALIEAAHADGVRLAIATTTSPPNVTALLTSTLGSAGPALFDVIAAGDSVARKKPAPDIYLSALSQLSLPAASCLAIEDSHNGLQSALSAGICTVVTPSYYTADEDFTGAAGVMPSLDEPVTGPDLLRVPTGILQTMREIHAQVSRPG